MRSHRSIVVLFVISLLAVMLFSPGAEAARAEAPSPEAAPVSSLVKAPAVGEAIPGRYIVVLKDGVDAEGFARGAGLRPAVTYQSTLNGFAAPMSAEAAGALAKHPAVAFVEPDRIMQVTGLPSGIDRIDADENAVAAIGGDGGLADIDVAVLDTGVDVDHPDLNVAGGANFSGSGFWIFWTCDTGDAAYNDGHGHGTHVSGTIGALDDGVNASGIEIVGAAPGARIWGIKVLTDDGTGATSCIIDGVDWVTQRKAEFDDGPGDGDPGIDFAVANMSLGGGSSSALCAAVNNSVNAGVVYAVAAGNDGQDAANSSPANCAGVITVSAIADFDGRPGSLDDQTISFSSCTESNDDSFACFSNYGPAVEVAAPGVTIASTYAGGGYVNSSGTSMASPHVAGAVALYRLSGYTGTSWGPDVIAAMEADGWTVDQSGACGFTEDPDPYPEPMIYVGSSCNGPVSPVTDVAVASVSAPASAVAGDVVSVDVTVENVGNQDVAGFDVSLAATGGSTNPASQSVVNLAAGASATVTFSWDTSGLSGNYTLTGSHDLADDDAGNDSASTSVDVVASLTDVAVTSVSAPASAVSGGVVSVDVTVENVGNQDVGGFAVSLTATGGSTSPASQPVAGLAAGASATVTFTWDTTGLGAATYTLTGSHDLADDVAGNDSTSTSVEVTVAPPPSAEGSLDVLVTRSGRSASSWVTVFDGAGSTVSGATVTGEWTIVTFFGTKYRTRSSVTGADGVATTDSGSLGRWWLSAMFCVTSVTGTPDPVNPTTPEDCYILWR